ncbi:MAG: DNA-binding transcriptional regulator [Verrucomicrobia bacterium]|nr:DNA-binding transcriptional regulator [Verrucomicrobiota bacterium]
MQKDKHKSILEVVHESVEGLYDAGLVDATTMHEFNALCLTPVEDLSPREIKSLRLREKVSQGVFALYLNTSIYTVQQWERGVKHPRGIALKMLNLIAKKGLQAIA